MVKLEDLKPGMPLVGLEPSAVATIAAVVPIGEDTVQVFIPRAGRRHQGKASRTSRRRRPQRGAYRIYTLCERKNWAEDARAYNEFVTSWSGIESAAKEPTTTQRTLFE